MTTTTSDFPTARAFEKATIIASGYLHGFAQFEVRRVRFHVIEKRGGGTYPAASFVRRGRRKEEHEAAERLTVVAGWGHPPLETDIVDPESGWSSAKYPAFSSEWDELLDDYLTALEPDLQIIWDGRTLASEDKREAERGAPSDPRTEEAAPPRAETRGPPRTPEVFAEGGIKSVVLNRYERDPEARRACIAHYGYACQVCGIRMSDIYGALGDEYPGAPSGAALRSERDARG